MSYKVCYPIFPFQRPAQREKSMDHSFSVLLLCDAGRQYMLATELKGVLTATHSRRVGLFIIA
jgi:hypothetical protein